MTRLDEPSQPSAKRPAHRTEVLKGIGFMCIAISILPFLNAAAKLSVEQHAVVQVVWARYAVHLFLVVLLFAPRRGLRLLSTRQAGTQLSRSALLLGSTACYFTALQVVPLPTAAAINFTSPIIVTLLAIPMLGEQVGWRRLAAVCAGFAGALVIIRPGTAAVHPAGLLVMGSALLYAFHQILTRRVSARDPPETSVTYMVVVGTVVMSAILPWFWRTPESLTGWLLLLSTGCFAAVGHFFVVKAFQYAPASIVSPYSYGQLLGAAVLGYVIWDHVPDRWTWLGAAMIVASGLYIAYREGLRRRTGGA